MKALICCSVQPIVLYLVVDFIEASLQGFFFLVFTPHHIHIINKKCKNFISFHSPATFQHDIPYLHYMCDMFK